MFDSVFPPLTEAVGEEGLLAFCREITAPMLWDTYSHVIFPWPTDALSAGCMASESTGFWR